MPKPITRKQFLALGAATLASACAPRARISVSPTSRPRPTIVEPGHPEYEALRHGFNLRVDRRPAAIARCRDEEDVASAIELARARGLPVAVRSGGHSLEGFSTNDGGLVLDLGAMDSVRALDDETFAFGPGCRLAAAYDALLPRGRLIPAGSCGTVGLGGLTLGGGYGFFSRSRGLTCDSLVRARFVDGRGRTLETTSEPDLDWAARGGLAANAAVATELVFRTHPAPTTMDTHRFRLRGLDVARARAAAELWFGETRTLGRDVFSAFVMNGSFLTIVLKRSGPDDLGFGRAGQTFAAIADDTTASDARPLAEATRATYGLMEPTYFRCGSAGFYRDGAEAAPVLDELLPIVVATRTFLFQVNTLGGAIADGAAHPAAAYPYRDRPYLAEIQSYWEGAECPPALHDAYERARAILTARGPAAHYASYPDLAIPDAARSYFGGSYDRLAAIRRRFDPDRLFRHPQSVAAAG